MTTTAIDDPKLRIGRVFGGGIGLLARNWPRVLVLALPLTFAAHVAALWVNQFAPRLHPGALTPFFSYVLQGWINGAVDLVPAAVLSLYFCRWAKADLEGGRKTFALGPPSRFLTLLLARMVVLITVGASQLLFILPAVLLSTIWVVMSPVVIFEGVGPIRSLARSAALTKRHRIGVFLLILVYFLGYLAIWYGLAVALSIGARLLGPQIYAQFAFPLVYGTSALGSSIYSLLIQASGPVLYFELVRLKSGLGGPNPAAVFD